MDKTTESKLLKACLMGDRVALGTLVTNYEKPIYNAAYRMLGDANDAADVAQTTFVKAFERLDRYDPKYRFFSWIYRIAVNESIDQIRRRGKTQQLAEDQLRTDSGPAGQMQADRVSSEVQSVLMTLPEDQRAVIVLHYFNGCSYQEMAEVLEIPEKTVKSRLFSARRQMKGKLQALEVTP